MRGHPRHPAELGRHLCLMGHALLPGWGELAGFGYFCVDELAVLQHGPLAVVVPRTLLLREVARRTQLRG